MKRLGTKVLAGGSILVLILVLITSSACIKWGNKPITPIGVGDGSGGVILIWGNKGDLWTQRLDAQGDVAWRTRLTRSGTAYWWGDDVATTDGYGGIIVAWSDWRNSKDKKEEKRQSDVYAQRVTRSGDLLWAEDDIPICIDPGSQEVTQVSSDGSGGAIIKWHNYEELHRLYAQRIDFEGKPVWQRDWEGYAGTATAIAGDGSGGAFVALGNHGNILIQRLNPQGEINWEVTCHAVEPDNLRIQSDSCEGAIVDWQEGQITYVHRVNWDGNWLWKGKKKGISASSNPRKVIGDGSGGAIVTGIAAPYQTTQSADNSSPGKWELHAHRMDAKGETAWRKVVWVSNEVAGSLLADLIDDSSGNAIIVWQFGTAMGGTVYAQKLDSEGEPLWGELAVEVCNKSQRSQGEARIVSDGAGGAIVIVGEMPTFVQRLDSRGRLLWGDEGVKISP